MSEAIADAYVRIRPKADSFKADTNKLLGGLSFGQIGKSAGAATLGILGIQGAVGGLKQAFTSVVLGAANFETELNTFQAVTGATADQFQQASKAAIQLGQDVKLPGVSAADAAVAMTELAKGGLDVTDSLAGVRGALELGTAANTDFGTSAQIIARNLSAFALGGDQASRVADLLAGASIAATGEVTDMAIALQQSATVAHSAGLSIDDTVTAIAELAKSGLVGSDAGTSLRTMLLRLIPSTNKAANVMRDLGIKVLDLHGSLLPLPQVAENYRRALAPLSQAQRQAALNTIFGQDAIRSATIFAQGGAKAFADLTKVVTKKGQADVLTTARTKGLGGSLGALQSNLETIAITIGQKVNPTIKRFVDLVNTGLSAIPSLGSAFEATDLSKPVRNLTDIGNAIEKVKLAFQNAGPGAALNQITQSFSELTPIAKVAVVAIGGVAAAVAILVATSFPITSTVLAIGGLALAFKYAYDHSQRFRDAIDRVKQAVLSQRPVWEQFVATVETAVDGVRAVVTAGARYVSAIWERFGDTITAVVKNSFGLALRQVKRVLGTIQAEIDIFVGLFTLDWGKAWGGLKQVARLGLEGVVDSVKTWGTSVLTIFSGVWKNVEVGALRGVEKVLSIIAKIPTSFKIFGQTIGFKNPAIDAVDAIRGKLAEIANADAARDLANAYATNTKKALTAKTRDITQAVEIPTKTAVTRAVKKVADSVKPAAEDAGKQIGTNLTKGVDASISVGGQNAIDSLKKRLRDAVDETAKSVREAVIGAQQNLSSLGSTLSTQLQTIIDNGPLGKTLKRLQDELAGRQAKTQAKSLRQAIVDAQKELTSASGSIANPGKLNASQQTQVDAFLKPKREQLAQAKAAWADFQTQAVIGGIQQEQGRQKAAVEKQVNDLIAAFNQGTIDETTFTKRISGVLDGQSKAFTIAGRTLGTAFSIGFQQQVAGVLLQVQAIQKARDKGLPAFLGAGATPTITEPLTVLGQQLKAQREILAELRKTRQQQQAAAAKAAAKANAKAAAKAAKSGSGVDLGGLATGATG